MKINREKITEIFTKRGKENIFVLIGILGVFLILISEINFDETDKKEEQLSLQQYKLQTEKEVVDLLREIDGVGEVKVMITLESGPENIYAQQQKSSEDVQIKGQKDDFTEISQNSFENEFVMTEKTGENDALVEKVMQPAVQGVAIVCSGGGDIKVVSAVTNSVSVVLGVPTHKIFVTKMR